MKQEISDLKAIASIYKRRGRYKLAADVLDTVLNLETHAYGPDNIEVVTTKYELAEIFCELKQYERARALIMEAAPLWRKRQPAAPGQAIKFTNALESLQKHAAYLFKAAGKSGDNSENQAA